MRNFNLCNCDINPIGSLHPDFPEAASHSYREGGINDKQRFTLH